MKKGVLYKLTALLVLFVLLMGLAGCSGSSAESPEQSPEPGAQAGSDSTELSPEQIAFQEGVYAVINDVVPDNIKGDKAACIVVPEDVYLTHVSLDEVPEELRTSDPSQVRYIIRIYKNKEIVGQYMSGSSISDMAYQWHYTVEIEDLKLNGIVDTKEFHGSEPPEIIKSGESPEGSKPDEAEINTWIIETISKGELVDKYPLLVRVPEGWGTPYVNYRDYMSLTSKWKTKQLIPDGEWYCIMLPSSVSELTVTTHPHTAGTDSYHVTQENFRTYQHTCWIIVEDLAGNATFYTDEPTV